MTEPTPRPPVTAGDPAPDFVLPAVADTGTISLADYRGSSALFLVLMVGLWCPFCRRQIVQLGALHGGLQQLGVQSLVVVATEPENARLYFRYRPTPMRLASDRELATHRAYGVPKPVPTPQLLAEVEALRIDPFGELAQPQSVHQIADDLSRRDGYAMTAADQHDVEHQWPQLKAFYLIDRGGTVRWVYIECAHEGLPGLGKMPSAEGIYEAARACVAA